MNIKLKYETECADMISLLYGMIFSQYWRQYDDLFLFISISFGIYLIFCSFAIVVATASKQRQKNCRLKIMEVSKKLVLDLGVYIAIKEEMIYILTVSINPIIIFDLSRTLFRNEAENVKYNFLGPYMKC